MIGQKSSGSMNRDESGSFDEELKDFEEDLDQIQDKIHITSKVGDHFRENFEPPVLSYEDSARIRDLIVESVGI